MESVLKIMTCGSVDDGKSTLIGHLLYDAKMLFVDQEKALELESNAIREDGVLDYSLLLDGLSFEREQGITIDVAYRYFATEKRSFVVADTPGHEEYTRNMAVAASQSDVAVLLIDASKGVLTQTRRHLRICSMMGIRYYVFAVNKMDIIDYNQERFETIKESVMKLMEETPYNTIQIIPISALKGDNITTTSNHMDWYKGPSLLSYLETIDIEVKKEEGFVMPVQRIARKDGTRYLQGTITSGEIKVHDEVTIYPGKQVSKVKEIIVSKEFVDKAQKQMAVAISLMDDIDISRGYVLAKDTELKQARLLEADILWMDESPLIEGKSYLLKLASENVNASIMKLKYSIDPDTGKQIATRKLEKNSLACVDITCHEDLIFDCFENHQAIGRFILIDKVTNATSGCGTIKYALRRSDNITRQILDITPEVRAKTLNQSPKTIWFTGLSGSGKSAVANELEKLLVQENKHTMLLDGDNIRLGINKDLGFNEYDRKENIRRVAEICKLMNDAGIIVLTAFISPFKEDREMAKQIIGEDNFIEIYVSTPLEECERRDVKGLYHKAREGLIPNFTGINSPYEIPDHPDIEIDTSQKEALDIAIKLLEKIKEQLN